MVIDGEEFGTVYTIGECMVFASITFIIFGLNHLIYIIIKRYHRLSAIIEDDDENYRYSEPVVQKLYDTIKDVLVTYGLAVFLLLDAAPFYIIYYITQNFVIDTIASISFTLVIICIACLLHRDTWIALTR